MDSLIQDGYEIFPFKNGIDGRCWVFFIYFVLIKLQIMDIYQPEMNSNFYSKNFNGMFQY